jgi:hypothetical protein
VVFVDHGDVDAADIGIHRHAVVGQVGVHRAPDTPVHLGLLHQPHAQTPHDPAHQLAVRGLAVDDAPDAIRGDDARYSGRRWRPH